MSYLSKLVTILTSVMVLCVAGGCTLHVNPDVDTSAFTATNNPTPHRIPQNIVLVLTPEFTSSSYDYTRGLDPYSWHVGPSLDAYAVSMAQRHFTHVEVVRVPKADTPIVGDLVLTPLVRKLELTSFVGAGQTQYMTVDVEWTLKSKGKLTPIWVATSSGQSEGSQGTPFSGFAGGKTMINDLVANLWMQTDKSFGQIEKIPMNMLSIAPKTN